MQIRKIETQCNDCGLCARDCIAGAWQEVNGRVEMVAPQFCNQCGHCAAICPKDAIFHDGLDPRQIRKIDKKRLDPEAFREIVRSRRSIRRYRKAPVPKEIIQDMLFLSAHSPTASNRQDVAYTVITDPAVLQGISDALFGFAGKLYEKTRKGAGRLIYRGLQKFFPENDLERYMENMPYYIRHADQGRDFILHNAPVLILVHAPAKGKGRFHCENCNIAAANLMNDAHARGLGTCYIGFLSLALKFSNTLRRRVALSPGRKVFACFVMGYPAHQYTSTASREKRAVKFRGHDLQIPGTRT